MAGSDDGVWDCDFAARRVFVSARARELAGMPPGPEMVPMDEWFASLPIHPEDLPRRIAAMQAHLAGKTPAYVGEFRLRQPDGSYRWRRLHGLCLRDADGNPHRMAGSISDIDARRRAEEALRLSEERYALALEASEEGHFDNDLEAGEIFVSARVNEIYGFPRQASTLNRIEFLNQIPFHPDDRHVLAELSRLDWQDPPGDLYEFECRIVRARARRAGSTRAPRWCATPKAARAGAWAWSPTSRSASLPRRRCGSRRSATRTPWRRRRTRIGTGSSARTSTTRRPASSTCSVCRPVPPSRRG